MSILTEQADSDSVIIHVGKTLDFYSADEFKEICQRYVQKGVRNFILDFANTRMLDSSGLGAIFSLYRTVSPSKGVVVLADVTEPVEVVVRVTRINQIFPHFTSVHAARRAVC